MAEIIRRRTGNISRRWVDGNPYWQGVVKVDGVTLKKSSKDRAVVEAWLKPILEANPTYVFNSNRPKAMTTWAARGREWARYAVTAETDPMTAAYHFHLRRDWRMPRRVIAYDYFNDVPLIWVADDNGGEGYTRLKAEAVAKGMPRMDGTLHKIRPMDGIRPVRIWDR